MAHDQHERLQELLDYALIGRKNNYQVSRLRALGRARHNKMAAPQQERPS